MSARTAAQAIEIHDQHSDYLRKFYDTLRSVEKLYREHSNTHTLDFRINEEAYRRLQGRPGISGPGYNRLLRVVEEGVLTHHLIVSANTSVFAMRKAQTKSTELTWAPRGFDLFFSPEETCIELCPITAEKPGDRQELSYILPKELTGINWMYIPDANQLIKNTA